MQNYLILTLLSILLFSCRKEANVKLPVTKSLPVINCFICPEDTIYRVKVTLSQPLYANTGADIYTPVNNAIVEIKGNQGNAQFIYNLNSEYYELKASSYTLVPGEKYKLTVTTTNGDIASAETQIPLNLISIDNVSFENVKDQYSLIKNFKVSFTDDTVNKNYYNLSIAALFKYSNGDTLYNDSGIRTLYDDINNNGKNTTLSGRFYYNEGDTIPAFDVYLLNCTPEYYKYHLSLQNYSGDNPFAEPTLVFNNIKGGYGIFASYRKFRKRITI